MTSENTASSGKGIMALAEREDVKRWAKQFTSLVDKAAGHMAPEDHVEQDEEAMRESKIPLARGPVLFGLWTMILIFGFFGLWSILAPLESAAIAPGAVVLDTSRKTIQHFEGGIIDEILVHEGMQVQAGQPLIRLSETAAKAKAELLLAQYRAEQAALYRLQAERDGDDKIEFPKSLLRAASKRKEVEEILDSQRRLFTARKKSLDGQVGILEQRINQLNDEIDGLNAQEKSAKEQLALLNEEIGTVKKLLAQGNAMKPRLLGLQRQAAELEGRRGEYLALIARAKQSINEADLEIINKKNEYLNQVVAELRETQVRAGALEEQVRASADILDRIVITAPQAGIVTGLKFHTKGGVIGAGEPIMDLIPQDDKLIIEAQVSPRDIDIVHKGLPARIRLTAYKTRRVPPVDGEVVNVSADRFVNQSTGEAYYVARVEVNEEQLSQLDGVALYPGMPADVLIVTGERTLMSYLISPITDAMFTGFREQ